MDVQAFNLHLVLIYIFMMSNQVETTFHMFLGYLSILFCGHLFTYFAFFIWVAIYWFVESGQPFVVYILLVGNFV